MELSPNIHPLRIDITEDELDELCRGLRDIVHSSRLILGPRTKEFEDAFAAYHSCHHAISISTGTAALEILLRLHESAGKKVAVTTNTNFASVAAILRSGGQPVFMDINRATLSPGIDTLSAIKERHPDLAGVMWVHIAGIITPDFEDIVVFCREQNLFLIEDAAHAHGSILHGTKAGNFADGGAFSFYPTKVMTTFEGGMITTNLDNFAELARSLRNQGKRENEFGGIHYDFGSSLRMSEIYALLGSILLRKLDAMVERRKQVAARYQEVCLKKGLYFCSVEHMDQASNYKFVILLPGADIVLRARRVLEERGVGAGTPVYEVPCHLQPVFSNIPANRKELSMSEKYCPLQLCPPITSAMSDSEVERVAAALECV